MAKTIAIVTPVLDDWASFAKLMTEISDRFTGSDVVFHICAVDDGSAAPFDAADILLPSISCVDGSLGARGEVRRSCCSTVAVVCPAGLSRHRPLAQMGFAIRSQPDERPWRPPPYTGFADRRTDRSASFPSSPALAAEERSGRPAGAGRPLHSSSWPT